MIWHHCGGAGRAGVLGGGHHGVTLFFAISGFLITTLLLREHEVSGRISLRNFYVRRLLRIFPLYYAVLGLYVVLMNLGMRGTAESREFFAHLPYFAAYLSNWHPGPAVAIFGFAWSLAAEEQFYAVWPWFERALAPAKAAAAMLVVLAALLAFPALGPIPPAIGFGVLAAHILHRRELDFPGARHACLAALALSLAAIAAEANRFLTAFFLSLLVFTCVLREDHALGRLLAWKPLAWIGTVSYGMYLFHILVCRLLLQGIAALGLTVEPRGWVLFVLTSAATIAVSAVSYRWFEWPFLQLKDRFR